MAVIDNRTTAEGDVLIIKVESPIVGLIGLYNFVDTTTNESETDYFLKEFRYSIDGGITFSSWIELTINNISSVDVSKYNQFVIEYRYTRVGDTSGIDVAVEDILVSGTTEDLNYPTYDRLYFKNFFEVVDSNVFGWALNVLEKLYQKGILPEYMNRGDVEGNNLIDQDFIVFWNTVTHYFAILVYMARQFKDITQNSELIEKFLINRGIEVGSGLEYEDLLSIFNDWVNEFFKRGTNSIYEEGDVNGELLRLIGFESSDEFILALLENYSTGWCIGKSSPCWKGTENITNIIKGYEYIKSVEDLDKYPLYNSSDISIISGKMQIDSQVVGNYAGIYDDDDVLKRIVISSNLNYEVSFFVEVTTVNTPLTFSLKGFDKEGNIVNFLKNSDSTNRNYFFQGESLPHTNTVYFIRGFIHSNEDGYEDVEEGMKNTLYPNGVNLRSPSNVSHVVPQIYIDNVSGSSPSGVAKISNFKLRPLNTPFTQGQLGIHDIVLGYVNSDGISYSQDKVSSIIQNDMINAGSFLKIKYI